MNPAVEVGVLSIVVLKISCKKLGLKMSFLIQDAKFNFLTVFVVGKICSQVKPLEFRVFFA